MWGGHVSVGEAHNRLLRINIISNKLHYVGCAGSKSTRRLARQDAVLRLIQHVLDRRRIPDVDLVLSISNRPTVPKALISAGVTPPPVFAYAITQRHHAVPLPLPSGELRSSPLAFSACTDARAPANDSASIDGPVAR